jgi:hypothetical protein
MSIEEYEARFHQAEEEEDSDSGEEEVEEGEEEDVVDVEEQDVVEGGDGGRR